MRYCISECLSQIDYCTVVCIHLLRIIYIIQKSQHQKNLVAFARRGGEVMVVSATVGGDTINVWRLPSWNDKMPFVMKPDSSFNIGGPIERYIKYTY